MGRAEPVAVVRGGLRTRLFVMWIVLVSACAAAADAALTSRVEARAKATLQRDLVARARLVAREVSLSSTDVIDSVAGSAAAQALTSALRPLADARVTLIRRDGRVLGDSDASLADPTAADLAAQPDVRDALAGGVGISVRPGLAGWPAVMHVAVPFERDGVGGAARLAESLADVDLARAEVRRGIWFAAAMVLALALILSDAVARRVSGLSGVLMRAARRMSDGDLTVRTRISGRDELAQLGQSLDALAGGLGRTLAELRAERDLQKRILEAMHDGVAVVDRHGRVALVNPALRSMLLLGADAVGKLLIETVRHAQLSSLLERARADMDDRPVEIELPGLKPRRVVVHAAQLSGGDEGILFVFVDVTELRRLESLRRDFVANASHELRTPIAAVRSATETLQSGALDDPIAAIRFVDIIERNAQRLQILLEDMLELSKLESNEFKLKRERVELQRVVPIVLALFRERAEKKGVRLAAALPVALAPVDGDARALEHVLSNLVDNAVKYCPPGSRILVGASEENGDIRLVVTDTGPGIAREHLSRLFERFYRVDAGRSRELGGTGLGLSIVKHMVEAMRGRVSVESAVGKGSTFAVLLHRASVPAQP
jgi:two-component system phosphate regulon sensor histidine kinase PhoR